MVFESFAPIRHVFTLIFLFIELVRWRSTILAVRATAREIRRRRDYATRHELRTMKKSVLIPADRHPCDAIL